MKETRDQHEPKIVTHEILTMNPLGAHYPYFTDDETESRDVVPKPLI